MEGNCKVNVVLYKYDVTNKAKAIHYLRRCILNVQRENGRSVSITTRYHLNTSDISIRQHFQGTCDTQKNVSREKRNLKWSFLRCIPQYSNLSKKCLLRLYEKLEIVSYQNQIEVLSKRSELFCKYHHATKFLLKNYNDNDFR